jgi:hypothetical protein
MNDEYEVKKVSGAVKRQLYLAKTRVKANDKKYNLRYA